MDGVLCVRGFYGSSVIVRDDRIQCKGVWLHSSMFWLLVAAFFVSASYALLNDLTGRSARPEETAVQQQTNTCPTPPHPFWLTDFIMCCLLLASCLVDVPLMGVCVFVMRRMGKWMDGWMFAGRTVWMRLALELVTHSVCPPA